MKIRVTFKENGSEYTGFLIINCKKYKKLSGDTLKADDVIIQIDEDIIEIEVLK